MGWLTAGGGYEVTLDAGGVVCRNAAGRTLGSIPAKLRDDPTVVTLGQVSEWLSRHTTGCRAEVERWMMGSLPVPTALLAEVWADETWRETLTDLLVAGHDPADHDATGGGCPDALGFLRDVGPDGVGIVDRDGETRYLSAGHVTIPHPVLLDDLDDLRELAVDLDVRQTVNQLFRRVRVRPGHVDPTRTHLDRYAGGRFARPHDLVRRATTLGYRVSGGYAVRRVFEAGREIEARVWIGADDHDTEAETGDLEFTIDGHRRLRLGEVTPVAWSEGVEMAAALYAGRVVSDQEAAAAEDEPFGEVTTTAVAASGSDGRWRPAPPGADAAWLEADAILPVGTVLADPDLADVLTARTYRHPAMETRRLVRLVPGTLGEAEDLVMEYLRFERPERVTPVGISRRREVGFPARVLVDDPANGRHALAVVKDVERLARLAKTRIGPAKDGFCEVADRLARTVPHFLPTFYEEAARAFLAADSPSYAAIMFGKARDAEDTYALVVDAERQHAVFCEFLLAGALSAKTLSNHAKRLGVRCQPAEAYQRFLRLCVDRVLGGLPPYAGMHTDLRRLAKAAGLSAARADEDLLRQIGTAPALAAAPEQFWSVYLPSLTRLAATDPTTRGVLLTRLPGLGLAESWLDAIVESGADQALTAPAGSVPREAESPDGPAGWLSRFMAQHGWPMVRSRRLLALAERMVPRLVADGVPVRIHGDLDVADLCVASGVPVTVERMSCWWGATAFGTCMNSLIRWLQDEEPGRRDLAAITADRRNWSERLTSDIQSMAGWSLLNPDDPGGKRDAAMRSVLAVPALRPVVHDYLEETADTLERLQHLNLNLSGLSTTLRYLAAVVCPHVAAVNPGAVARISRCDVAGMVARMLRSGVLNEYAWPAFEKAASEWRAEFCAQWPYLMVGTPQHGRVLGPEGVIDEHRMPDDFDRSGDAVFRYADGQVLLGVCRDRRVRARWSDPSDEPFTAGEDAFPGTAGGCVNRGGWSIALPDGGRTTGGRPLRAGDRAEQAVGPVMSDGTTYWVRPQDGAEWREYDPASGVLGRVSAPGFLTRDPADGQPFDLEHSYLRPLPDGCTASPLGASGGLAGWRTWRTGEGALVGEDLDGRRVTVAEPSGVAEWLLGSIAFPGSDRRYAVTICRNGYQYASARVYAEDGFVVASQDLEPRVGRHGQLPPGAFWHYLSPRDEAGSRALRALTDQQATALLTGALARGATGNDLLEDLVRKVVPQISDPVLVEGVGAVVTQAVDSFGRIRRIREIVAAEAARGGDEVRPEILDGPPLWRALSGLVDWPGEGTVASLRVVFDALTVDRPPSNTAARPSGYRGVWRDAGCLRVLDTVPALMLRAASPLLPPDQRTSLVALLETIVSYGLCRPGARLRLVGFEGSASASALEWRSGTVIGRGNARLVIVDTSPTITAVQYAPDGDFAEIPDEAAIRAGQVTERDRFGPVPVSADEITGFVGRLREHGPYHLDATVVARLSESAGMSLAEAAVLLAGLLPGEGYSDDSGPENAWGHPDTAEARAGLGVSASALGAARLTWRLARPPRKCALLTALSPAAAGTEAEAEAGAGTAVPRAEAWEELIDRGPRLDGVVRMWREEHGRRDPVPDELIVEAQRLVDEDGYVGVVSELLHGIANPDTWPWLAGPVTGFDGSRLLAQLATLMSWLAYALPVESPVRAGLPETVARLRQRMDHPSTALACGYCEDRESMREFIDGLGLGVPASSGDAGDLGVVLIESWSKRTWLRPAHLKGPDDPVFKALAAFVTRRGTGLPEFVAALLRGDVARMVAPPMPAVPSGYLQNPLTCVPDLVGEVAARTGLSTDAATMYLQLLALPDPTDRNVARWTGWRPARLKTARAELAAGDLVVTAKRTRAGRSLFLPGGWVPAKSPAMPVERWKLPMVVGGEATLTGRRITVPTLRVPELFAAAWQRVVDGDAPRFEEPGSVG